MYKQRITLRRVVLRQGILLHGYFVGGIGIAKNPAQVNLLRKFSNSPGK